jgi:hypothetical protein
MSKQRSHLSLSSSVSASGESYFAVPPPPSVSSHEQARGERRPGLAALLVGGKRGGAHALPRPLRGGRDGHYHGGGGRRGPRLKAAAGRAPAAQPGERAADHAARAQRVLPLIVVVAAAADVAGQEAHARRLGDDLAALCHLVLPPLQQYSSY